jgi:hypothetical protein
MLRSLAQGLECLTGAAVLANIATHTTACYASLSITYSTLQLRVAAGSTQSKADLLVLLRVQWHHTNKKLSVSTNRNMFYHANKQVSDQSLTLGTNNRWEWEAPVGELYLHPTNLPAEVRH